MAAPSSKGRIVGFGPFDADLGTRELRRHGHKIRLQEQPFRVLAALLQRPGEVITREELHQALWPDHTHVEFDHGLNTAMRKIRQALDDSADTPRFIETLPRQGYRFLAPVEVPPAPAIELSRQRVLGWFAIVLAAMATGAVSVWFLTRGGADDPIPQPIPLTTYPGIERSPSFSPDGSHVAFSWNGENQDNFDIYVKVIGSDPPHRLTTHSAPDSDPAWSPDGRWIAFLRDLGGKGEVLLIPAVGGIERKLAETKGFVWDPNDRSLAWSPDSKWLVVTDWPSPADPSALFLVSVESGERRQLTFPPAKSVGDTNPAFSPDGARLVFTRPPGPCACDSNLYLLRLDGRFQPVGEPQPLTSDLRAKSSPTWTANGRNLIFSGPILNGDLWKLALAGHRPYTRIAAAGQDAYGPVMTAKGRRLAFTRAKVDTNIWRMELLGQRAVGAPSKLIASTRIDSEPQYSPDGSRIVFSSDRSGRDEIFVCDRNGGNPLQLTSLVTGNAGVPHWSPDGHRIVFDSNATGQLGIYTINAGGGKPERISEGNGPSWSGDGGSVYFASERTGQSQVWKLPMNGGPPVQLTKKGGSRPVESPDHQTVYYLNEGETSVWKVPVGGGEETFVLKPVQWHAFAVVDKGIYYITPAPNSRQSALLQFHSLVNGKTSTLATVRTQAFHAGDSGLAVSPDEKWILYTQLDQVNSDLMLIENFP
jgi:Tol biopolymer transport system component/DNA-binding winged helix-turn-helix (wHTH) protein